MDKCCSNCFVDMQFKNYITSNGFLSNCDFCQKKDTKCIYLDNEIFFKLFKFLKSIYEIHPFRRSNDFFYILSLEWGLFEYNIDNVLIKKLCANYEMDVEEYYLIKIDFEHLVRKWHDFRDVIKHEHRFINRLPLEIETLFKKKSENSRILKKGEVFYRARIGGGDENALTPYGADLSVMGMPPLDKVRMGRANPDGIRYLYLANEKETAIAEVRPWCGAKVTIGDFKLRDNILSMDFSYSSQMSLFKVINSEQIETAMSEIAFFKNLSNEMSKPISPDESYLEYIPTQFITEVIKSVGYEGMVFNSSLSDGLNVVLFSQECIDIVKTDLYKVHSINYDFLKTDNYTVVE
ncbi:RES family NAD+ phosphorylase [Bacillus pumilus]|uniref:RES family NAD+ phosphorylase n=1 Tax=Bacillus pumilus TaxID=1408 RepID=UPI00167037AB|nr:RES family NAD+ phosphorylase [Bacillus pumilus]